jgi:hypothetical protein
MSTITREAAHVALPTRAGDRGDALFGAAAVLIALLALVAKLSGLFG